MYLPIDSANFVVTGQTASYYRVNGTNPARPIAYNVLSKNNTPWRYNYPEADLTVGTVVAQTDFEIINIHEDSVQPPTFYLGNWCLKPYIADGQLFAALEVGSLVLDYSPAQGGTQFSFEHFVTIGTGSPRIRYNQWSETGFAEPSGYSVKFSLYPQANI